MVELISIIKEGDSSYPTALLPAYSDKVKENGRRFEAELYVCDKDVVYNDGDPISISSTFYGITEDWLLDNNAYIHKFDKQTLIDIKINEEMCSGSTYDVGAVVSQQMTARLYRNDDYLDNCTTPDEGYTSYFENKCLIAFSRLALREDENGNVTHWGSVPLGVFYVTDIKGDFIVELTCYDKMLQLEKKMIYQNLEYYQVMDRMVANLKVPTSFRMSQVLGAVQLYDENGEQITVPTDSNYRDLLKYTAFYDNERPCAFIGFNRYGVLDINVTDNNIDSLTSDDIMQSNYSNANIQTDCKTVKVEFGSGNQLIINNGYPVTSAKLEYLRERNVLEQLEHFSASQEHDLTPCTMQLHGFPHYTLGDIVEITLQEKTFDYETGEYTYTDKEPFYIKIHKQELTIGSSVSQTVQCFDVNTDNLEVASNNNGIDLPTSDGLLNLVFGSEKFEFPAPIIMSNFIEYDEKTHYYRPIYEEEIPREYYIFATPKAKRPSKIFPPSVDYSQFQSTGEIDVAAYCNTDASAFVSWIGFKLFNYSNANDQLLPGAYVTKDYLLVDNYEEYHEAGKGYIILDYFIIQWGIINVKNVSDAPSNEYYADLYYETELADEPMVMLMPSSRAPGTIQSWSYLTISDNVPITKGLRVYTCDTNLPVTGRDMQFIILGRTKSA